MTRVLMWRPVLIGWALAAVVLIVVLAPLIIRFGFHDPDDAMRYLEVRDWLAGQSWWDVDQHRLGGGDFRMHWSRLVDLPLAAVIAPLAPLIGLEPAARVAMVAIPLVQLLIVIALLAHLTRRLLGDAEAGTAILIVPVTAPLLAQFQPMRIDHHGWQIVLAVAAVSALLGRRGVRSGALAGAAAAALITISLEGLPFAGALTGVAAVAWALDPRRTPQLRTLVASLFLATLALHLATRGPHFWAPACDAVAPVWLTMLMFGALGTLVATAFARISMAGRLAMLVMVGGGVLAMLLLLAPECARGPFAQLDPLTRRVWFENIAEGLPVWKQRPIPALITFSLPAVGLVGAWRARRGAHGECKDDWAILLALQGIALLLALMVLRAGGTANALSVPGAALIVTRLLERARAIRSAPARIGATAGALAFAAPGLMFAMALSLFEKPAPALRTLSGVRLPLCDNRTEMSALAQLPPARLYAPLDISPAILARTPHSAVASGYHRNVTAMHEVLATFLGSAEQARRAITARRADYVVGCPGLAEPELFKKYAPNGFWAQLERGEQFDWLEPVQIPHSPMLVWRVVDPSKHSLSRGASRP
ncbi:hypothetical protein [Sphingomonas sp. DT-204]|uniref:hypothetical protein n=1 Tax=Sphingomonas sp. DT-204 TaxID=3396166 RepID=UPI003F1C17DB